MWNPHQGYFPSSVRSNIFSKPFLFHQPPNDSPNMPPLTGLFIFPMELYKYATPTAPKKSVFRATHQRSESLRILKRTPPATDSAAGAE
jgi:hypothetical protein